MASPQTTRIVYVIISLTFSYLLFFIATPWVFSELHEYRQKNSTRIFSKKSSIVLVDGVCDFGNKNVINTSNKFKPSYNEMPRSINKEGGVEFSYTFWIHKSSQMNGDKIIFTKGLYPKAGTYSDNFSKVTDQTGKDVGIDTLVACPMLKLSDDILTVTFNTSRKIKNEIAFEINKNDKRFILSSETSPRWFMFSLIFKEGSFTTEYGMKTKGIVVDLYLNEAHIQNKFIEQDTLKLNDGDFHFLPEGESDVDGKIGNLFYYNWALTPDEVSTLWSQSVNIKGCSVSGSTLKNNQINRLGNHGAKMFF